MRNLFGFVSVALFLFLPLALSGCTRGCSLPWHKQPVPRMQLQSAATPASGRGSTSALPGYHHSGDFTILPVDHHWEVLYGPWAVRRPIAFRMRVLNKNWQAITGARIRCTLTAPGGAVMRDGCEWKPLREGMVLIVFDFKKIGLWKIRIKASFHGVSGRLRYEMMVKRKPAS